MTSTLDDRSTQPLAGVTVVDLGQVFSVPYCTLLLAYLGAEVIKVEPPIGDLTRHRRSDAESYAYVMLGSNKKSVCLDLKTPEGYDLVADLIRRADIVVENFGPGTMERLNLSYETLAETNPGVILGSLQGFNRHGPRRDLKAMDITIQAMTAVMSVTGFAENPPVKAGVAIADMISGVTLTVGLLAALYDRERTGVGQHVEVAMQDSLIPTLVSNVSGFFESEGRLPERTGNLHAGVAVAPYNAYECSDGWLTILCAGDKQWADLLHVMGREDCLSDVRFADTPSRAANVTEVDAVVSAWTAGLTRADVVERVGEVGIPCASVYTLAELIEDEFHKTAGALPQIEHPSLGPVRVIGNPIRMSRSPETTYTAAPHLGEDSVAVLTSMLDLTPEQVEKLISSQVVRVPK